jgi:hypothetical protein
LGRLGRHPVAGQVDQPSAGNHDVQIQLAQPHGRDLGDPGESRRQVLARRLRRPLAPALQIREASPFGNVQQAFEHRPLLAREQRVKRVPQALRRVVADLGHQPGQGRDPRQQHPAVEQPHHGVVEDGLRAIAGCPRPGIHPRREFRLAVSEVPQRQHAPDLLGVLEASGSALGVALDARRVGDGQLIGQVLQHRVRDVQRIGQEQAQVAHRGQLQGKPEPVVVPASSGDQRLVGVVEEEDPLQLRSRRRSVVATVEAASASVRNSTGTAEHGRTDQPHRAEPSSA